MAPRLTRVQWLICVIAAIGFAFDIYEILMLPLIVGPALLDLVNVRPGTPAYNEWVGLLFWIPAIAGGIFGLLGGYLTDRLGRRRVLVWSILIYAFSVFAAGYSTNIWQFLFFRCTTFIGVCVEFVAAVAWLAELFPDHKQRERVLGYTQAFSSVGGIMVTGVNWLVITYGTSLPTIYGEHDAWRYTLMSGVIPALPLIIIRPFLPESPAWQAKRAAGTLKRPSLAALFTPELRRTTIVTTIMFALAYGAAFGAIQHMPRIVRDLPELASAAAPVKGAAAANVQWWQEIGGLVGRFVLAMLLLVIVSRRSLLRVFQIPGLVVVPLVFWMAQTSDIATLKIGMFFAGLFTVAQFSFWGNYLPRMYPTHLRGTGEGFAANVGGRMLGTSFAYVTTTLASSLSGPPYVQLAVAASMVAAFVYVGGVRVQFLPAGTEGRRRCRSRLPCQNRGDDAAERADHRDERRHVQADEPDELARDLRIDGLHALIDLQEPLIDLLEPPVHPLLDLQKPPVDLREPPVDLREPPVHLREPPVHALLKRLKALVETRFQAADRLANAVQHLSVLPNSAFEKCHSFFDCFHAPPLPYRRPPHVGNWRGRYTHEACQRSAPVNHRGGGNVLQFLQSALSSSSEAPRFR